MRIGARHVWASVVYAWDGSVSFANAWGTLGGATVLYILVRSGRVQDFHVPEGAWGVLEIALICVSAMWVLTFVSRLLYYPVHSVLRELQAKERRIRELESQIQDYEKVELTRLEQGLHLEITTVFFQEATPREMHFGVTVRNLGPPTVLRNWKVSADLNPGHFSSSNPQVVLAREVFGPRGGLQGQLLASGQPVEQGSEWKGGVVVTVSGPNAADVLGVVGAVFTVSVEDVASAMSSAEWVLREIVTAPA